MSRGPWLNPPDVSPSAARCTSCHRSRCVQEWVFGWPAPGSHDALSWSEGTAPHGDRRARGGGLVPLVTRRSRSRSEEE